MLQRALFVDRDGTIIVDEVYAKDPERVTLIPGAAEALARARERGFCVVLVSNQSGIARGLLTDHDLRRVHHRMVELLAAAGTRIDASYYCTDGPDDGCSCRKPAPGLLWHAADDHGLDVTRSIMVGDKVSDVEAGRAAGCRRVMLLRAGPGARNEGGPGVDGAGAWPAGDWGDVVQMLDED